MIKNVQTEMSNKECNLYKPTFFYIDNRAKVWNTQKQVTITNPSKAQSSGITSQA